jgi:hypothetical protein
MPQTKDQMANKKVLVIGVALSDKPNNAVSIMDGLASSQDWQLDQRWHVIGENLLPKMTHVTSKSSQKEEKFKILNRIISEADLPSYEYLFVFDDDVEIPPSFVDQYLQIVDKRRYVLSQPARTHASFIDHYFVAQLFGIESRQTRFVEIGPVTCIHNSAYHLLLPFDLRAPMGWGLDFHWPTILSENNLKMGIIDQIPIEHSLRKPVAYYNYHETESLMQGFLKQVAHINHQQAFTSIETFPLNDGDEHSSGERNI